MSTAVGPGIAVPLRRRAAFAAWIYDLHPTYRLIARWAIIAIATFFAFRASLSSLAATSRAESLGAYVWTVPAAAILVAIGVARRHRTELPIHDRQTDVIVGVMGFVLAVLLQGVLMPRYALYFNLLRLDLVAMWLYVVCCCTVLFGLRPVMRFAWVWGFLLLVFPLPYHLVVASLGGGNFAAGSAALVIAGAGTGIAVGRTIRRGFWGSVFAWIVGFAVLILIDSTFTDAPLQVYQQVPALAAMAVVGLAMFAAARRGMPKQVLERKIEPLAAKQVWSAIPMVVGVAVVLATMPLPTDTTTAAITRTSPGPLAPGHPLVTPPNWSTSASQDFRDVNRLYGTKAVLVRQTMVADTGSFRWDKQSRPRTLVVDSLISERPFSFGVYPGRVLYGLTGARFSALRPVNLGMGVTGQLASVVDDKLLVTWNALQFAWGDAESAERVTIFAVDDHRPDAPFPTPSTDLTSTLRTLLTLLFRGNAVLDERTPTFKDADLLTGFGRALVAAQWPSTGAS